MSLRTRGRVQGSFRKGAFAMEGPAGIRWRLERAASRGHTPCFDEVLRSTLEEDDGLVLRVAAYERMTGETESSSGRAASIFGSLIRRSWKIFDARSRTQCAPEE